MAVATQAVDKILARTYSQIEIKDIFQQADQYAEEFVIQNAISEIMRKTQLFQHDYENQINFENLDCEEPPASELDVYATFHLKVKKTTIISKYNQKETTPFGNDNLKHAFTYKGPSSIYSMNMKLQQKNMKHLVDKGDDILPKPLLNTRGLDDDRLVTNYRKKKEKEEKLKEEERHKQEALEQRLRELDEKGNSKDEKNMKKRLITYDSKGDVIFIKNFRADVLPNPLLNPPYKIKSQKQSVVRGTADSQLSEYNQTQRTNLDESNVQKKRVQKIEKVQLLSQIEAPQIKNEVIPMGSVFNETEPSEGIKVGEGGKFKYGSMNLSKRDLGQMSLDEYKIQKDYVILQSEMLESQKQSKIGRNNSSMKIEEQQTLDLDQTKEMGKTSFDFKLKQVQMQVPTLNLESLNQSQMAQTLRLTQSKLDLTQNPGQIFQSQSSLISGRFSQDRVIRKKDGFENLILVDRNKNNQNFEQNALEYSSYIETLKQPKSRKVVSFATTQLFDFKPGQSALISARHSSLNKNLELSNNQSARNLPPLLTQRKVMDQSSDLLEKLRNKNNEIITNDTWGQNPSDTNKMPKRIEKKPKPMELKKSNSQLQLSSRKKERHFIESVKHKLHLPPPPLGKTFGHGISQLPTILNPHNQSTIRFL